MASDELKALQYLKRKFKTKSTTELLFKVEELYNIMRKESQKEIYGSFKSSIHDEVEFVAEAWLDKD